MQLYMQQNLYLFKKTNHKMKELNNTIYKETISQ